MHCQILAGDDHHPNTHTMSEIPPEMSTAYLLLRQIRVRCAIGDDADSNDASTVAVVVVRNEFTKLRG